MDVDRHWPLVNSAAGISPPRSSATVISLKERVRKGSVNSIKRQPGQVHELQGYSRWKGSASGIELTLLPMWNSDEWDSLVSTTACKPSRIPWFLRAGLKRKVQLSKQI